MTLDRTYTLTPINCPIDEKNEITKLENRLDELINLASIHYGVSFVRPKVLMNLSGSDAGQAFPIKNLIRINKALYQQNPEDHLKNIIAHEMAHIVVHRLFGSKAKPHGNEWKAVMKLYQVKANRCHSYNISLSGRHHFIYGCSCPNHEIPLTAIRHNRSKKKGVEYYCNTCKSILTFLYDARKKHIKL